MAVTNKTYLDLAGLTHYNGLIKNYIDTADAKSIKYAALGQDGNNLLLYKTADGSGSPAFTIPMGSAALKSLIKSLGTAVGATYTESPEGYSISFSGAGITASADVVSALNTVADEIGTIGSLKTTDKTSIVAAINEVLGAISTAIAGLDVDEFALASQSGKAITIKGIKEVDGKIAIGDDAGITLADVASTGAAADVSTAAIDDGAATPKTLYPAGTAQGTLQAIARDVASLRTGSAVTISKNTSATGLAAQYTISQGGVALSPTIDIPKDMVVESGVVVDVVFVAADSSLHEGSASGTDVTAEIKGAGTATAEDAGKYIKLTIANSTDSHLWIKATDLVDVYTGGTTSETSVDITNNVITASIVDIDGSKITYKPADAGSGQARESASAALARLDGSDSTDGSVAKKIKDAIGNLDTASNVAIATYAAGASGTADVITLTGAVNETDGIIAGVSTDNITLSTITNAEINSLFA